MLAKYPQGSTKTGESRVARWTRQTSLTVTAGPRNP